MDKDLKIPNVVYIGNCAYDINTFPKKRNGEAETRTNTGGACLYSAIPASNFYRVGIVSKVGDDFRVSDLQDFDIDFSGLKVLENEKSTRFYHEFITNDGQIRELREEINPKMLVGGDDIPELFFKTKHIHLTTNAPEIQLELIKKLRQKSDAIISVDTILEYSRNDKVKNVFDLADIAFIDKEFSNLLDCKAKTKIIKLGKIGCKYISDDKNFTISAAVTEDVVDKTGAGDCLNGVFINLLANGHSEKDALEKAVEMATLSIKEYGILHMKDKEL